MVTTNHLACRKEGKSLSLLSAHTYRVVPTSNPIKHGHRLADFKGRLHKDQSCCGGKCWLAGALHNAALLLRLTKAERAGLAESILFSPTEGRREREEGYYHDNESRLGELLTKERRRETKQSCLILSVCRCLVGRSVDHHL